VTSDPAQIEKFKGKPVLGIFGKKDGGIKAADVEQFGSALAKVTEKVSINLYPDAGHGFMRPGGPQYNATAAADAWNKINEFFAANLKR
jgi:carboxymethylenebutenolidase